MERTRIFWISLFALVAPLSVLGVDDEWNSTTSGNWTNGARWSLGRPPSTNGTERVFIYFATTVTVDNAAANLASDTFTNTALYLYRNTVGGTAVLNFDYTNSAVFRVAGPVNMGQAVLNWNAPNGMFHFDSLVMNGPGVVGTGELNLFAGRWFSSLATGGGVTLGAVAGSSSVVNIYSNASLISLANFGNEFGGFGSGQVNIMGGTLNLGNAILGGNAGSTGRIVMTSGSIVLTNANAEFGIGSGQNGGSKGYGELIISNGNLFSSHIMTIGGGYNPAGGGGRGVMKIYGGTHTNLGFLTVGASHNSTGTVLMAGGTWDIRQTWLIGGEGTNSFGGVTVSNGTLRVLELNKHILLGNGNTSYGELNVAGGTVTMDNTSFASSPRVEVGVANGSTGRLRVTGGLLEILSHVNSGGLIIATNTGATGSAVLEGGLVRIRRLDVGAGGVLSNRTGGVLQFMQLSGQSTVVTGNGAKIVDGGTLSYKNYSALNTTGEVSKFTVVSGSVLQLDSSTNENITGTYTLTNAANSFKELSLTGESPRWQSDALQVASGARLFVSNAANARVNSVISNLGTILVQNSTMTYEKSVTVNGRYVSDPSTNTYNEDVTVGISGTLEGGAGDRFDFKKSLLIQSTNNLQFNVALSTISFSGGGDHTNAVTGGDFGTNSFPAANFSYGTLQLGASDDVFFISGGSTNGSATANALYVDHLILGIDDTNLVANLHSSFNIYYMLSENQPGNTYLGDLTYSLDGGGLLIPAVPEPSTLALLLGASVVMFRRRRR